MSEPTFLRRAVAAGASVTITGLPARATIHIQPGSGGTMTAKVRAHEGDVTTTDLDPTSTSFSAAATRVTMGPLHSLIVSAATAEGAVSISY